MYWFDIIRRNSPCSMLHAPLFTIFLFFGATTNAQFYESGTEPTATRWQQINTEHFRIIFPKGSHNDGQHAANVLEYIYQAESKTLNNRPKKIPVVLHNQPVISNGFVSWAPKRSEWFLTPPQNNYAHNWLEQLAVHEYRHVVQMDKLNQGFTRALGFAIGEQGVGAVAGLLPRWFLEGDAVATETALTSAGRGRNPDFEMPLRTIALSGKYHKYDKALFGSYKDHVPNHYELGYQMTAWTRERYGAYLYDTTVDQVARRPFLFFLYPFRLGLKNKTGYNTSKLYDVAFSDLTLRWNKQAIQTEHDSITAINRRKTNLYTSYRSPQYMDDATFLVQKTGMAQIAQWVTIDQEGNERVLFTPGTLNSERISYAGGRMAWTELIQDVRWSNRSYSVIKVLNTQTGKVKVLQRRSRLFAPALSPDGATVAAIEVPLTGESSIVLLDAATGDERYRIGNPGNTFLQMPSWSRDGTFLLVIVNGQEGKSIARVDIATGGYTTVLAPTYDDISHPADAGKQALFTGYYNGITNIYAVDYLTGNISQVTSSRFGAFDPQPHNSGSRILYTEYSAKGYNVVEANIDTSRWTASSRLSDHSLKLYETLAQQENFNLQDSVIPNALHTAKPFRKWANLLHVHSWAPLYYNVSPSDIMSTDLYPGLVLLSQDLLGNLTSSAGYSWRGYNAFHAAFTYRGLYPVIDFTVDHGGRKAILGPLENAPNPQHQNTEVGVRTYVPFMLTRNKYITGLVPQVKLTYNSSYLYSANSDSYQQGLWELRYSINAYRYLKISVRDIAPKWGIQMQGAFHHAPANTEQLGYIYYLYGRLYLPGIARHHSLQLSGAWQQQQTAYFLYGTILNFPRGYSNDRTEKLGMGAVDYSFPLCYPDWNLGYLIYMKRLRTNLFCDFAENQYRVTDRNTRQVKWQYNQMLNVGIDLLSDINILRINFPIMLGLRTVYVPDTKEVQPHLLFSVSLN